MERVVRIEPVALSPSDAAKYLGVPRAYFDKNIAPKLGVGARLIHNPEAVEDKDRLGRQKALKVSYRIEDLKAYRDRLALEAERRGRMPAQRQVRMMPGHSVTHQIGG